MMAPGRQWSSLRSTETNTAQVLRTTSTHYESLVLFNTPLIRGTVMTELTVSC